MSMSGPQIGEDPGLLGNRQTTARQASTGGSVIGTDFRSNRRERIYDADTVWSGEHTIRDYTEI